MHQVPGTEREYRQYITVAQRLIKSSSLYRKCRVPFSCISSLAVSPSFIRLPFFLSQHNHLHHLAKMTLQSLENAKSRPSTDNWRHSPDPSAVEMSSAPRLSVNAWRNSSDIESIRPNAVSENPFRDPNDGLQDVAEEPMNPPSAAHTHQDHQEHQEDIHPTVRTIIDDDIEAARNVPKEPSPSITALNLNLPYVQPRVAHPQKTHRIFLTCRLLLQVLLFVLALIGYLLAYPRVITYRAMLTGNSLGFVIVWTAVIVLAYFGDRGVRMSRYSTEGGQWKKIAKMLVIDIAVVVVWLLVCWGNTGMYSISRTME